MFWRPCHFLVVTQVVEDQPVEEGYFGDAETSDAEEASED